MARALGALLCAVVAAEAEVPARGPASGCAARRDRRRRDGARARRVAEHRVEQDLTRVFADFANGTAAPGGGLAGWFGRRPEEASPGFTAAARTCRAPRRSRSDRGKVAVNYETGEVASLHALLSPSELKRLADQIGTTNLSSLEAHLLRRATCPRRVAGGSRQRQRRPGDAAPGHALPPGHGRAESGDGHRRAGGGLPVRAAHAGLHARVVVGPPCLDLIRNLEQAETLAQFGSIFLLFSHGLMYSHYYDHRKKRRDVAAAKAPDVASARKPPALKRASSSAAAEELEAPEDLEDLDDLASLSGGETPVKGKRADFAPAGDEDWAARRTFGHGFSLVFLLGLAFAAVAHALGTDHSRAEQTLVAAAFSLSSSSTARLEGSLFGRAIVELLSVQDLVLAPLLALPTAVHELRSSSHSRPGGWMLGVAGLRGALGVVVLSRGARCRARWATSRGTARPTRGPTRTRASAAPGADAARPLRRGRRAMALLGDRLKLSHEAGALFAGLVLVGTPHVDKAKRAVSPLAALFGGMYVASLGLVASPQYVRAHFGAIMGRVTVVVVIKVAVVGPMVYALGFAGGGDGRGLCLVTRHTYLDVLSTTIVLLAIAPLFIHVLKRVDRSS
ncbi:solute:proton antiporter [Aureococcus anophagefferens]|nr:solute:proton antiporter [Aureococcus anophagefferens]